MRNLDPLVAVCVPSFNHSAYVLECLQSILDSDYGNLELVIIDDGSSDASPEIIEQWLADHESRFARVSFARQDNAGICVTLNRLVANTTGEFIAFVASDDRLLPDGIRVRVDALQARPSLLAVYGDSNLIDRHGKLISTSAMSYLYQANKRALTRQDLIARELILNWSVPGPAFMARKISFDESLGIGLYNEKLKFEDRDYYLRLLSRDAVAFVDRSVADYRVHDSNVSRARNYFTYTQDSIKPLLEARKEVTRAFKGINRYLLLIEDKYTFYTVRYLASGSVFLQMPRAVLRMTLIVAYKIHTALAHLRTSRSPRLR